MAPNEPLGVECKIHGYTHGAGPCPQCVAGRQQVSSHELDRQRIEERFTGEFDGDREEPTSEDVWYAGEVEKFLADEPVVVREQRPRWPFRAWVKS